MATLAQKVAAKRWFLARHSSALADDSHNGTAEYWSLIYTLNKLAILDELTRDLTAFDGFMQMILSSPTYVPTLRATSINNWRSVALADAYDDYMRAHSDTRRAVRE